MTSLLKPKNIRRLIVGLLLLAPIGYLFGTQIATLAGAHGEEMFAEPVYTSQWVDVDNYVDDGSDYRFVVSQSFDSFLQSVYDDSSFRQLSFGWSFKFNGVQKSAIWFARGSSYPLYWELSDSQMLVTFNGSVGSYRVTFPWVFEFSADGVVFYEFFKSIGSLQKSVMVPTSEVVENSASYTDYLFGNMFGKSNFLTVWGVDALSDNRRGFSPVGELFSYVDENVLHLADTNIGKMAYGYMYYVVHVLLLDLVAMAFVFIVSIPERILDQINGKAGGDW